MPPEENTKSLDRKLKAVLTEYNDCRDEIKTRIQQRTRMTEFFILGLAAIAGFAVQSGNYFIMFIAPAYAVFIYAMIDGTYFYTDSLSHYIREEIELKKIPHILGEVPQMDFLGKKTALEWKTRWLGWETNFERCLRKWNPVRRRKILYFFSWGIVLVSSISCGYGLTLLKVNTAEIILVALVMLLVYGLIIEWVSRKEYVGKRRES